LYDAVYDLYADVSGFSIERRPRDDAFGNYYPNGDVALFYDDPQHPGFDGHTLMATGYWAATESIL
jgi:hypothetical protein